MSSKRTKRLATLKRRNMIGGILSESSLKELEAQKRLGGSCCAFFRLGDDQKFLILSHKKPELKNFQRFIVIMIGVSTSELGEASEIVAELKGNINDIYSSQDFHPTVALYFISKYLKRIIEEFFSPRALAVDFVIFDPFSGVLHTVKYNGDYETHATGGETDGIFAISGAYNSKMRKELAKEAQKCLDGGDISDKRLEKLGKKIGKKYGLTMLAVMNAQVVNVLPKQN
ncbi:MAG: hypothetical protein AAB799_01355 [Patescibacteria group bacterium]